jgi:ABC-2 type transport system permease protein
MSADTSLQHPVDTAPLSETRPLYWSIRRELWENRSIYLAPLIVAAVFLFGFLISTITLPHRMRAALALGAVRRHEALTMPYQVVAGLLMATAFIVGFFYCLDALYGERRDRSILLWKSLPVSDRTTVLAKASIPLVILPLLAVTLTVAVQLIMLLLGTAILLGSGLSAATLWAELSPFRMTLGLLYHLLIVHSLWHAPLYGWLLLVSAWARRAAFLWALLPLLAIGVVERIVFNTFYFVAMLKHQLAGGAEAVSFPAARALPMDPMTHIPMGLFLITPSFWIGLIFTAACLAAAIRLRRNREPI